MKRLLAIAALIVLAVYLSMPAQAWILLRGGSSTTSTGTPTGVLLLGGDTTSCLLVGGDTTTCLGSGT